MSISLRQTRRGSVWIEPESGHCFITSEGLLSAHSVDEAYIDEVGPVQRPALLLVPLRCLLPLISSYGQTLPISR